MIKTQCNKNACKENRCKVNEYCVQSYIREVYRCGCDLKICASKINLCESDPCSNNGRYVISNIYITHTSYIMYILSERNIIYN